MKKEAAETSRAPRICIMGASLDGGNLGVRALACSLIHLVHSHIDSPRICFLYGSPIGGNRMVRVGDFNAPVEVVNFRLSPRAFGHQHMLWILAMSLIHRLIPITGLRNRIRRATPWIDCLLDADMVGDIRGGDSFSDIYGQWRFWRGSLPVISSMILGKRPIFLPQTIGPFQTRSSRWLARRMLRRTESILVRDAFSATVAGQILRQPTCENRIRLSPDVAFTLPSRPSESAESAESPSEQTAPLVGINVSGLLYLGHADPSNAFGLQMDYPTLMENLVRRFLAETNAEILLFPHVLDDARESDSHASESLLQRLPETLRRRIRVLSPEPDPGILKHKIAPCQFVISSRMHACIGALTMGIPAVGLAYSRKFVGVFATIGLKDMTLDARKINAEELIERCVALYHRRHELRERVAKGVRQAQKEVNYVFKETVFASICSAHDSDRTSPALSSVTPEHPEALR